MDRLQELEKIERSLPLLIENAIERHKANKLQQLYEKDKANPEGVNARVKRYNEKHKEEIMLKRKAKRLLEKAELIVQPKKGLELRFDT